MAWFLSIRQWQHGWRLPAAEALGASEREQDQDHCSSIVGTVHYLFCPAGQTSWEQKGRRPSDCTQRDRILHGAKVWRAI